MSIKESTKAHFLNKDNIIIERIKSTKVIFIFSVFFFFLNIFLVGAKFKKDFLLQFIPYTYTFFLLLLYVYIILIIKYYFKNMYNLLYFIICFILFIIFIGMLFPFILKGGVRGFINF